MHDAPERPIVSVVIPCFNQARFLAGAVGSVRAQRYGPLECVIVNDGSTDDTAVVAASLGVRVVEQVNQGLSEARNAGLAAARGELVVFLDADDELLPDAIERGAAALASDPLAAAVAGRCQVMDAAGVRLPAFHAGVDRSRLYEEWLSRNFVWTPGAAMFRRRALQEIGGFPPGLGPASDYAVYLRLAREGRVRLLDDELVRYRQHEAAMSRNPALMLRATLAVLRRERREAPRSRRRAVRRGRACWCDWYGEQTVDRLRADWRARRVGLAQARAAALVVRHCPGVASRHLLRKSRRVLTALARRTLSPFMKATAPGGKGVAQ